MFKYGMRLRPFSIGCQPMEGLMKVEEDHSGKYWNILYYAFPLNDHEQEGFELDYLGEQLEQESCDDIKEYYKDIWDCDINHPRCEDTVAEIVEKSYMSGYVQGVENTAKEFRFELEQEPCEDAISRNAMLDYQQYLHGKMSNEENYKLWEFIKDLPSVIPAQKWISCSDRLPKKEEKTYWVCTDTEYQCECRWTNNRFGLGEGEWGWSIFDTPQYSKPIAWMPLPEPYKAEKDS